MREVVVLGVGMTQFGNSELSQKEMFAQAAIDALEEGKVEAKDLQALFIGNVLGGFTEGQINIAPFLASEIGMPMDAPATRFEAACASATVAIRHGVLRVAPGVYDLVMVGGTERTTIMGTPLATRTFAMGSHSEYERFAGITFPAVFGMAAHFQTELQHCSSAPPRNSRPMFPNRYLLQASARRVPEPSMPTKILRG